MNQQSVTELSAIVYVPELKLSKCETCLELKSEFIDRGCQHIICEDCSHGGCACYESYDDLSPLDAFMNTQFRVLMHELGMLNQRERTAGLMPYERIEQERLRAIVDAGKAMADLIHEHEEEQHLIQ